MNIVYYEDEYCFYVRKPAGIPTTYGKEKSFLEYLIDEDHYIIKVLKSEFDQEEEYGLLNRLDNATSWLLYFAKTKKIKDEYKKLQQEGFVKKIYLLEVYWDIQYWIRENGRCIDYPIAHHKYEKDRMVVIKTEQDKEKWEPRLHHIKTEILESFWCEDRQTTILLVFIQKWIRHQIRSHFSSIGYPIVWDDIYWKKKDPQKWDLQLFSVGLLVKK